MKVLLVTTPQSPQSFDRTSVALMEPLALEYLGAAVRQDHDVKLLDLRVNTEPGLKETLESFQPDIIACGAFTPEVNQAREICAEAKRILPGILTVVGGIHAWVMPEDFFEDTIDMVVQGEGCFSFKKICDHHETGKSFEDIENLHYKNGKNGKWTFTYKKEHPPLDELPFPARTLTSQIRHKFINFALYKFNPSAMARSSLGCWFNCKFCAVSSMVSRKMYFHSIDRVIEELHSIEEKVVMWVDDEFLLDPKRAVLLAKAIEKAGIKKQYFCYGRSDSIVKNPESLEEWAKIGLKVLFIGLESDSQKYLKEMRKATTLSKNEEALRICKANGLIIKGGFIAQPDYGKEDFKNLAKYIRKVDIDQSIITFLTPLPGTQLWEERKDDLITRNYNLFDLFHTVLPTKLPIKQFYEEYSKLVFKRSTSLRKKIKLFRKLDPGCRKELITFVKGLQFKMKNAYKDYDEDITVSSGACK